MYIARLLFAVYLLHAVQLTYSDHREVTEYLRWLNKEELMQLGRALGLQNQLDGISILDVKELCSQLTFSWLLHLDDVMKKSGKPSWESLIAVLRSIGHERLAQRIQKGTK